MLQRKSSFPSFFLFGAVIVAMVAQAMAGFSTVVIDAGHGGHDLGGIPGQRVPEKGVALDVARRLRDDLREAGLRVVMTRGNDTFISLSQRSAIANAQRHAVFVCIHFNSASRVGANGCEVYYYLRSGAPLAASINARLGRIVMENRGVKRRGYYVLRKTRIPGVLCECGFLTNPAEAKRIQNSAYRERLAGAIASAIIEKSNR